jgi:hypothetical protein
MREHRSLPVAIVMIALFSGCAGKGSLRPPETLRPLKKAAEEETESVGRFSRKAVSDAEMLQGHSAQEYRDSVVP